MKKIVLLLAAVLIIDMTLADEKLLFPETDVFKVSSTQESASLKGASNIAMHEQSPKVPVSAKTASATVDKVSYVLQVTSDLHCDQLDIELISESGAIQILSYTTSAFAALDLQPSLYSYGDLTCLRGGTAESFSVLNDKLDVVTLSAGSHYYGGRLIFIKQKKLDTNANPEVLDNCPEVISRARGEASNECRDGVGIDSSAALTEQINIFAPEVTETEIEAIRKALSVDKSQLQYLPIKLK